MADLALPEAEGFRAFADRLGTKPSYVTELRKAGRLVLTDDGRGVRVAASLERIQATRNPAHEGVRARHAAGREAATADAAPMVTGEPSEAAQSPAGGVSDADDLPFNSPHQMRRAKALADKEEALARKALRDEQLEMGQLLVLEEVVKVVVDAGMTLRRRLELLPDTLASRVTAMDDESQARMLMRDEIEQALEELDRKLRVLGKGTA
ncbi:hypothetical protein [Pseudoxanthomonas sp. USHLN014]|uniref:hypothetical protein n=1 Tax=Pseudoxanthomonas sp. USHLN014 TaxID=3081297 RepID=UPI00301D6BCB